MANRFWVGGTASWSSSNVTNWSATSGGVGGASIPTNADSVFIDANSGSNFTITLTSSSNTCLDLDFTGSIGCTFAGSLPLSVFGSLTLTSSVVMTFSATLSFKATTTGKTVTTAGISLVATISFASTSGGWTLQDNFTTSLTFSLFSGTLDTNNKTISCNLFNMNNTNTRTLTLGSSTINCLGGWNAVATGLTFNAGTSTLVMNGATHSFDGGGLTYNNVTIGGSPYTITGNNTFNVLAVNANSTLKLTSGTTQTITNLVSNGTVGNLAILSSVTAASAATISTPSAISVSFLSVQDITRTGAGTMNVNNGTNVSGNTGITFLTGYLHKIMGQLITKTIGITPIKVNGV